MIDEARAELTADDLALVSDPDDGAGGGEATQDGTQATTDDKTSDASGQGSEADKSDGGTKGKTIVTGADAEADDAAKEEKAAKEHKPYWPEDWREKLAEHRSAGDPKAYKKELARLKNISDPAGVYGMWREAEGKITSGGLVKLPGKDAKEEEIKSFQKALGWTEKPEEMLDQISLADGAVLGDDDKPVLNEFLSAVHGATSATEFASKATNWYLARQDEQAAALDDADDEFHRESISALKEEWGPAYKRKLNSISGVFATAPGGADIKNPNSLWAQVAASRTPDGQLLGNHPDWIRLMAYVAGEINPAASVVEDGNQSGLPVENELNQIRDMRRTDSKKYWSEPVQKREQELIAAQQKIQERQRD